MILFYNLLHIRKKIMEEITFYNTTLRGKIVKTFLFLILIAPTLCFAEKCYSGKESPKIKLFGNIPNKKNRSQVRLQLKGMKSTPFGEEIVMRNSFELIKINNLLPKGERKNYCVIYVNGKIEALCLGSCN